MVIKFYYDVEEHKNIELRSEEVQEVMGEIPSWIIRSGISLLFIIVIALVIGSCFFRYPDVISTQMTLTSHEPVAPLVARTSGKICKLYVEDGEIVHSKQLLIVLENPAITDDVLLLEQELQRFLYTPDSLIWHLLKEKELMLGDIQNTYTDLLSNLHAYQNYKTLNYYPQKIKALENQLKKNHKYYQVILRQRKIVLDQYRLAEQQYNRDSLLYAQQVISAYEHETARSTFLQNRLTLETADASLESQRIQIGQLEENLLDLHLEQMEKENVLIQNIRTSVEQVSNAINSWKLNYCIYTPIEGKVTFTTYWHENQFIPSGDIVCTIVPQNKSPLIGKATLPVDRSGKVKIGQRVIVRFLNYPDEEFGIVEGKVSSISLVPSEENYVVEIDFPNGLKTNYDYTLPILQEMTATAEIVTEDLRLIERFIQPLKKIWKEGF